MSLHETTTTDKNGNECTVSVELGDNLEDAVKRFGEDTVYLLFVKNALCGANRQAKKLLSRHKGDTLKVCAEMAGWKPESREAKMLAANRKRAKEALAALPQSERNKVMHEQLYGYDEPEEGADVG